MLSVNFFRRTNVVAIARDLIGTYLFTRTSEGIAGGMIIETEGYSGVKDRASHAYGGRRTKRTEMMYAPGGITYVYLCYGMYPMLNIVTNKVDNPDAVLIRAIEPTCGIHLIKKRRQGKVPLASGPGRLTEALGITMEWNGLSVSSSEIWLEPRKKFFCEEKIQSSARIGIDYAKEDALLPWRFFL